MSNQSHSLSNIECFKVRLTCLAHHTLKKETTMAQLSIEEGRDLEGKE